MEFHPDGSDREVLILAADNQLDTHHSWGLIDDLQRELDQGARALIVDCSGVGYVSSIAVCTLIRLYKRLADRSGAFRLAAVQPQLMRILTLTRLDVVFEMSPSVQDARESIASSRIAAGS